MQTRCPPLELQLFVKFEYVLRELLVIKSPFYLYHPSLDCVKPKPVSCEELV